MDPVQLIDTAVTLSYGFVGDRVELAPYVAKCQPTGKAEIQVVYEEEIASHSTTMRPDISGAALTLGIMTERHLSEEVRPLKYDPLKEEKRLLRPIPAMVRSPMKQIQKLTLETILMSLPSELSEESITFLRAMKKLEDTGLAKKQLGKLLRP